MPTNLYGTNDNYDDQNSHVMAALLKKFYIAKNLITHLLLAGELARP